MPKQLKLPLVESLLEGYSLEDFSNVKIIGCQHILETTHSMFRSLFSLGLKPENVSLIGKCYSTCKEVYEEMLEDGIGVSDLSFAYSSHTSFDDLFKRAVTSFLSSKIDDLRSNKYELIIVLDDGGKFISELNKHELCNLPIVGIEQTSAGYRAIEGKRLFFPVINVARSPLKLELESPLIAVAVAERMQQALDERRINPKNCLIIGAGPIGKAMQNQLSSKMAAAIYDKNPELSEIKTDFISILENYQLIIGCTGSTSIPESQHSKIARGTVLVSASSSDREFDAFHLRRKLPENTTCHCDLYADNKLLLKSGFPINFDGDRENIEPGKIQLTIALITAAILQAKVEYKILNPKIEPVESEIEKKIKIEYLAMQEKETLAFA